MQLLIYGHRNVKCKSFQTVYGMPILSNIGVSYTIGKVLTSSFQLKYGNLLTLSVLSPAMLVPRLNQLMLYKGGLYIYGQICFIINKNIWIPTRFKHQGMIFHPHCICHQMVPNTAWWTPGQAPSVNVIFVNQWPILRNFFQSLIHLLNLVRVRVLLS